MAFFYIFLLIAVVVATLLSFFPFKDSDDRKYGLTITTAVLIFALFLISLGTAGLYETQVGNIEGLKATDALIEKRREAADSLAVGFYQTLVIIAPMHELAIFKIMNAKDVLAY